jgi:hypothetical protein
MTNTVDAAPTQGKPRCITLILIITIYLYVMHLRCRKLYGNHMHIYIYIHTHTHTPMSLTSVGASNALLRFIGGVINLPLLTIGDYYYYSKK